MSILEAVETVAEIQASGAQKKGLELLTYVDPKIPQEVKGDATRIKQILSNFLTNAIKFTKTGYILLSAELISISENQAQIMFKCIDTGIGIRKQNQKKVFQRFVQVEDDKRVGWGLGLKICNELVKLMKGKIGLQSTFGKGSTFWYTITLPVLVKDPISSKLIPSTYPNVVLANSNPVSVEILRKYLTALGVKNISMIEKPSKIQGPTLFIIDESQIRYAPQKLEDNQKQVILVTRNEGIKSRLNQNVENPFQTLKLKKPVQLFRLMKILAPKRRSITGCSHFMIQIPSIAVEGKSISALVVEDNIVVQKMLEKLLRKCGVSEVVCAMNGVEALQIIESKVEPFDLIFMDVQMPEVYT